jgi:hypothetical protein
MSLPPSDTLTPGPSASLPSAAPGSFSARYASWAEAWRQDWRARSAWARWLPLAGILAYFAALLTLHALKPEHLGLGLLILALSYSGRVGWAGLQFILPAFLTGVIYDSQRHWEHLITRYIRVTEPYRFDQVFFGIHTADGRLLTPNEWWQLHTHWALDLVTGFFYLTFVFMFIGVVAWFRFGAAERIRARALRPMWAFFWTNILGYSTYYWFAAAPPWYVSQYGLGPANLSARPNAAGCLRFDELLGTHFFTEMYGRSADVFGAIPSLHVTYPLIACWYAFKFGRLRAFCVSFYLIMCFSAVYLNHHYVLDVLWGSVYALGVCALIDAWAERNPGRDRVPAAAH